MTDAKKPPEQKDPEPEYPEVEIPEPRLLKPRMRAAPDRVFGRSIDMSAEVVPLEDQGLVDSQPEGQDEERHDQDDGRSEGGP